MFQHARVVVGERLELAVVGPTYSDAGDAWASLGALECMVVELGRPEVSVDSCCMCGCGGCGLVTVQDMFGARLGPACSGLGPSTTLSRLTKVLGAPFTEVVPALAALRRSVQEARYELVTFEATRMLDNLQRHLGEPGFRQTLADAVRDAPEDLLSPMMFAIQELSDLDASVRAEELRDLGRQVGERVAGMTQTISREFPQLGLVAVRLGLG